MILHTKRTRGATFLMPLPSKRKGRVLAPPHAIAVEKRRKERGWSLFVLSPSKRGGEWLPRTIAVKKRREGDWPSLCRPPCIYV